jgi:hypothetical protein
VKSCYACGAGPCRCKLCVVASAVMLVVAVVALLDGCGASNEFRVEYALEQARCIANEREIIRRPDTTYEEDVEALELERLRCDAALNAIEDEGR